MKLIPTLILGTAAFTMQAATTIDLTTPTATSTNTAAVGGSFIVTQINPQSTGTGVIDSFLRVQATGATQTSEQGYNTAIGTPYDDKGGVFTRPLLLSDIPIVTIGGVDYRQFLLDINQTNDNPLISLNQIQIFQLNGDRGDGSAPGAGTYPQLSFTGGVTTTEVFKMSAPDAGVAPAGNQFTIKLDYSLNAGSGSGDMFLYVRDSDFATGVGSPTNVILYTQFGMPPGSFGATNDGFEEWAVLKGAGSTCVGDCIVNTPEPGSVVLFGTVLLGVCQILRKRVSAARV